MANYRFRPEIALPSQFILGYTLGMSKARNGNGQVLGRLLSPVSSLLNEEAARKLIGLKADRQTQARVAELADKCNEGSLTSGERAEYEMYVLAGELIAILQAKARLLLARRRQPTP